MLDITKIVDALHLENALDADALTVRIVPHRPIPDQCAGHRWASQHLPSGLLTRRAMTYDGQQMAQVRNPMLIVSAVTWVLLLADPGGAVMSTHDTAAHSGAMSPASLHTLLAMHPPASLAAGWVLMLVAMMSPVLISPVGHLRVRSFAYRRARAITLFVAAYAAIWIVLGGRVGGSGTGGDVVCAAIVSSGGGRRPHCARVAVRHRSSSAASIAAMLIPSSPHLASRPISTRFASGQHTGSGAPAHAGR